MRQVGRAERLLEELYSGSDENVVAAALGLFELGEYGAPAGIYLLVGGKAALRLGRLAEAVVLLHHGVEIAEPNTKLWAALQVDRARACAHHGFYRDAVVAGERFLQSLASLPPETSVLIPFAHHAVGFGYDGLREHRNAAHHYRLAVDLHSNPVERARASVDLAFALALDGRANEADHVLQKIEHVDDPFVTFVLAGATATVRYHQGRIAEAVTAGELAQTLAFEHEQRWAVPLAEIEYWLSRAVYQTGDRYRAAALALRVAINADQHWRLELRNRANDWLTEIMDKGGIQ